MTRYVLAVLLLSLGLSYGGLVIGGDGAGTSSVVTNVGTASVTNDFSSNPTNGSSGWVLQTSSTANVFWDSGSNAVAFHWIAGASGQPWFGYTSGTTRASGVYTMNWETIAIADAGGRADFLEVMVDNTTNGRVDLGLEALGLGQHSQTVTGAWNRIRFKNEGGGGGSVKMWIDNVFVNDTNTITAVTTNTSSGGDESVALGHLKTGAW